MASNNQISPQEAALQMDLIKNPKYDSDWIAEAAKALADEKCPLEVSDLAELNALQIMVINEVLSSKDKEPEEITKIIQTLFNNRNLNATQMRLYWVGLKNGLSENIMSRFLNPNIPYAKSNYVIQAICDGFTGITEYIDDYDTNQIAEIYAGMKDGVEYKLYANPRFSSEFMNLVRHAMLTGIHLTISTDDNISIEVNAPKAVG